VRRGIAKVVSMNIWEGGKEIIAKQMKELFGLPLLFFISKNIAPFSVSFSKFKNKNYFLLGNIARKIFIGKNSLKGRIL